MTRSKNFKAANAQAPTSPSCSNFTALTTLAHLPKTHLSHPSKPLGRPSSRHWILEQRRKAFLHHLAQWALCHDSSPYFHGQISLLPGLQAAAQLGLNKSVVCLLTHPASTETRKTIVVRLFAPQDDPVSQRPDRKRKRHCSSMHPLNSTLNFSEWQGCVPPNEKARIGGHNSAADVKTGSSRCYQLMVRCGAGWVSAREYFSKLYFAHLRTQKRHSRVFKQTVRKSLGNKPNLPEELPTAEKDSITVQPLFHPFRRLPAELQDMIMKTAAGHMRTCDLSLYTPLLQHSQRSDSSPISLSTMFRISKAMNVHLVPYVFRSTDFCFGLTGFTNFLWQCGPVNRLEIRRLTFRFGKRALLHCIRWLAPDPVFDLLEPPVVTEPRALQYFWRCQLQDLARELHLLTLTLDLSGVPADDIPMMACILQRAFGSVQHLRFVKKDASGHLQHVQLSDGAMRTLDKKNWREMCGGYLERHRLCHDYYRWNLMQSTAEEYDTLMDEDKAFFGERNLKAPI